MLDLCNCRLFVIRQIPNAKFLYWGEKQYPSKPIHSIARMKEITLLSQSKSALSKQFNQRFSPLCSVAIVFATMISVSLCLPSLSGGKGTGLSRNPSWPVLALSFKLNLVNYCIFQIFMFYECLMYLSSIILVVLEMCSFDT